MLVYKNYDQSALDKQYNNRGRVADFEAIEQGWQTRSEAARQRTAYRREAYGAHEREYVDIFPGGAAGSPVQVFFHGGYWKALETRVFHFLADGFLPHGATMVFVNYPLAPAATMDEIVDACRRAMAWIYEHIAGYGGDPDRLYISGHSAGGHLVAMLMATDWPGLSQDLPVDLVKGGCAISGLFDLTPIRLSYVNEGLNLDEAVAQRNSPVLLAPITRRPLIIVVGERESDEYHAQGRALATAWAKHGLPLIELEPAECNHFTVLEPFIDSEAELHQAVSQQMGLS